jgi:hypothetical protein
VTDEEQSGCPSALTTEGNTEQIHTLILENRRVIIDDVVNQLQIKHCSAYEIIHDRLHFHKVCARWVPK